MSGKKLNRKAYSGEFTVEYTTKDIMDRLESQTDLLHEIRAEAKKTNGRITRLEKRSVGMLISNNPWKAIIIAILVSLLLIYESRTLLVQILGVLL